MLPCQCQVQRPSFGKELFTNMYISTHIYTCEKVLTKTQSVKLALALQAHFLEWRSTRFVKELFNYTGPFPCGFDIWSDDLMLCAKPYLPGSHCATLPSHVQLHTQNNIGALSLHNFYCTNWKHIGKRYYLVSWTVIKQNKPCLTFSY